MLTGAAVLGKTFDPDLAAALVDLPADEAQVPLEQAVERRMLWVDETTDGDRYAFVHDKLRETLLDRLDPERRRRFHLEAAERIEIESPGAVYELAYHFHAAGEPERALPYALPAAQRARDRYALETAETYYRIAADGVASTDRDARLEIHGGLGETLILAGRYEDAEEALEPARELARTEEEIAEIEGKLGELAFKRGDMVQAVDASQRALNALGERIPSWTLTYVLSILWETLIQITHSLAPSLTVGRRTPDEADLLTVRQYTRLAYASWFTKGTIPTLWAHLRELNLSERYPPTAERAQAYATHAPLMTQLPWFSRGERYANRGIEVAERLNDPYREGVARHFRGLVRYGASQYHAALETLHEAEHLLRQTGDRWEANTAGFHIAFCLYRLGRLDEAAEKAQDVHEQARRIGDRSNVGLAVEVWAKATDGALPRDVVEAAIEATPASDGQTLEAAYQALGLRELRDEDPEAALEAFERAAELRDSADLRSEYVAPIPCWRATALRRWAETVDDRTPHRRAALLDRAAEAARRATRTAFLYANNRPHAYRERGLIAALKGRSWWARYWLDKSLDTAEEQSAAAERARTLRARAELAEELGWSDVEETDFEPGPWQRKAREPRADAEADEPTLSLVERFSALLDEGREIATGLSEEEICTSVHEAALGLLRGTHCALLEPQPDDGRLTHVHGDRELPVQEALVHRAVDEDRIVCQPGDDLGGDEAAMASETPSVLVAPIRVDGEPSFALYVAHDEIRGLFGETERRLASFITAIGGAALENAVNVQELAELNQRLEEKVDERTAELETRLDQQARVATLGRDALAMEDPDSLIDRVCRVVQDTLGVTGATVLELEPDNERIRLRGTAGWELPEGGPVVAELGQGSQAGYTIDEDGPVVSGDLPEEDRFDPHPLLLEEGIRSSVSVPIPGRDGSWGVLGAHVREPAAITPDDANFVQAVANVLGAGLQHHQARRKLEEHARELEHANEDLRQFAYVASHDLREPIRMVSSYVQLLESRYGDQLDDEAKEMIEYAVEGTQRLHELIKGLLTYSRVDQGASQAVDVDLNVLVDEVRQSLQHQIDRSDATIHVDELPEVHVDRSQISQVLQNLLSNAMKFRRPDVPPVVEVSAEREPDAWRISVADNGVGLDPERAERLFEIFQRGQQRGEYDGQGVGLAVCKKIVGRHGGDIWVDSDGEAGSTFHVLLPDPEAREGQADAGLPETTRADTIPDEDD